MSAPEPPAPDWSVITDDEFNELLRLSRMYHREGGRAEDAKAYLPACVMVDATLEASLICMVHLYWEDIPVGSVRLPMKDKKVRHLLDWHLDDLIRVAIASGWLPSGIGEDEDWNTRRAKIGDYARWLKAVRNLVHPARYAGDHPRGRITKRMARHAFDVFRYANDWLVDRYARKLRERGEIE